jgi:UDPglucose 6-dehydrogenase
MKVAVVGLWHLGTVTAACLATAGHIVVGIDESAAVVADMDRNIMPVNEPGLAQVTAEAVTAGRLRFSTKFSDVAESDVVWICYDTPVDENDVADVEFVTKRVLQIAEHVKNDVVLIISSQIPVGTTRKLSAEITARYPNKTIHYAYSPENLRLGKALDVFANPDRVVVGCESEVALTLITVMLSPYSNNFVWMSIESAEMTKHALNAFLAVSVSYINEIATICEQVGADAKEVERGLKTEQRIGPKAYLSPGAAFAGGTLARDVSFLVQTASKHGSAVPLLSSVRLSNEEHKQWAQRRLLNSMKSLVGEKIGILGLTYKSGTDTLRRSSSVELCEWLAGQGAHVNAHDPAIKNLPEDLKKGINLKTTVDEVLKDAKALVIATEWPEFRSLTGRQVASLMAQPLVLDANGFLRDRLEKDDRIRYLAVGRP